VKENPVERQRNQRFCLLPQSPLLLASMFPFSCLYKLNEQNEHIKQN